MCRGSAACQLSWARSGPRRWHCVRNNHDARCLPPLSSTRAPRPASPIGLSNVGGSQLGISRFQNAEVSSADMPNSRIAIVQARTFSCLTCYPLSLLCTSRDGSCRVDSNLCAFVADARLTTRGAGRWDPTLKDICKHELRTKIHEAYSTPSLQLT
jgi:hypothetical protein